MRLSELPTIYKKEMLDMARDRRTMLSMVVAPVLAIPLLLQFMGFFVKATEKRAETEAVAIAVAGADRLPGLLNALAGAKFKLAVRNDVQEAVNRKEVAAAVEAAALKDGKLEVRIYADYTRPASEMASSNLRTILEKFRESSVNIRLHTMGVPESVYDPFEVKRVNLAKGKKMANFLMGPMLGYVVILLMFSGGMYAAIDLTAGEKERRTLEVLLAAPAGRNAIVLAKLLATSTAIFLTALLSLASMALSLRYGNFLQGSKSLGQIGPMPLDAGALSLVALALLPTAVMAGSLMIAIALFAKSFKEAQSYLTPLILAVIFPLLAGMLPGMQLTPALSLIPLFNVCQLIKEIFLGDFNRVNFAIAVVSTMVYAAIAFLGAVRAFQSEKVLFRT